MQERLAYHKSCSRNSQPMVFSVCGLLVSEELLRWVFSRMLRIRDATVQRRALRSFQYRSIRGVFEIPNPFLAVAYCVFGLLEVRIYRMVWIQQARSSTNSYLLNTFQIVDSSVSQLGIIPSVELLRVSGRSRLRYS